MIYNLVRRLTVRRRIVGGFTIVLVLLFLSLPLVVTSTVSLMSRVQQLTDVDIRVDRLLLLTSRQTLLARINLLRYTSDVVPSPAEALSNLDDAVANLDEAKSLVETEEEREIFNRTQASLNEYAQVIRDVQTARSENRQADVTNLIFRTAYLGNDIEASISEVLGTSETRVIEANASVLAITRSRIYILFGVYAAIFLLALVVGILLERSITRPVAALQAGTEQFGLTRKPTTIPEDGRDELSWLARSFNQISGELSMLYQNLESEVANRTRALETSTDVSRRLSTLLDQKQLLATVVDDVKRSFGYYHVAVFLYDLAEENLILESATGEAGKELLRNGFKIASGKGLIGRAAQSNKSVLVPDAPSDSAWLPNPLLPETKSEVVVPIALGTNVLGVLDVQHSLVNGLSQQDVDLLGSIANQLAVALQNAKQYEQTQAALDQVREGENRFRAIYEGSNDAIMLLDDDGFFDCNGRTLELFGFDTVSEFTMHNPADVSPPLQPDGTDSLTAAAERMQTAYRIGNNRFDWIHRRKNGEDFPAEVLLSAFTLGEKRVVQATVRDTTERQLAQQAMEKQARELAKVAEISTISATVLEPDRMLQQVVNLIKEGFNLYHSHIYLLDETGDSLVLTAGAGEVGKRMVQRGWRIPMDRERSLVARAARDRQGVIINDVRAEPDFLPNELLPDTAAEMAVPVVTGDLLLGVLDVQSDKKDIFTPADVSIQMTLASQVAVALNNARQYQRTRASEKLIRSIVDATPDWIFVKDLNHRYRMVNEGYASALKRTPESLIGMDDLELGYSEELVRGDPEKGIRGYWADDDEVAARGETVVIQAEKRVTAGKPRWLNTVKVPLKDEDGKVWGVLGFVRDITDRELLRQETEDRLAELNALYKVMSQESWKQFERSFDRLPAYLYDQTAVIPADEHWMDIEQDTPGEKAMAESLQDQQITSIPISLRGEVIGNLAIQTSKHEPLTSEETQLLQEMTDQIALALESARLFFQTQQALGDTQTLYTIIAEMNAAQDYNEILKSLSNRTILSQADQLLIMAVFDQPMSSGRQPEWIVPVAYQAGEGIQVAQRYPVSAFEAVPATLFTDQPVILDNLAADERLDRVSRTLFQNVFHSQSSVILPLMLADQSIGFVQGYFSQSKAISQEEIQRLTAVASQAAIAVQSRLLLEQAQTRARQEARIRDVTTQVFGATDVDTIMRRAVEQIGKVLKLPAFIYLGQTSAAESAQESNDGSQEEK